jgi:hypothetical protein
MQLLKDLREQIDRIWEPVLCPVRTPIHEEMLGQQYMSLSQDVVYKRDDGILESFDKKKLVFSTFVRVNESMKSLVQFRQSSIYGTQTSFSPKKVINDFRANNIKSKA